MVKFSLKPQVMNLHVEIYASFILSLGNKKLSSRIFQVDALSFMLVE